ncbi:MAG: ABC transporter substrate-binding protein [Thermodesulfobacteriota bacterium]
MARIVAFLVVVLLPLQIAAAEKIKFSTPLKTVPHYALPMLAAEEKGIWKQEGLEGEWIPFRSGGSAHRAFAAGAIQIGIHSITSTLRIISRGVPVLLVADLKYSQPWYVVVLKDSPMRSPQDLKGAAIGISRNGSTSHAYGRVTAKALGLEKSVRLVATGGTSQRIAALKARAIDAAAGSHAALAKLYYSGEVRVLVDMSDYLAKGRSDMVIIARKELIKSNPKVVTRAIKVLIRATQFVLNNREWSEAKLQSESGYSAKAARQLFNILRFSADPKVERQSVEAVRNFLINYGLLKKDKAPAVDAVFTNDYLP